MSRWWGSGEQIVSKSLGNCEQVVIKLWARSKLWASGEQVVSKWWISGELSGEEVVSKLWASCKQVVSKWWTSGELAVSKLWANCERVFLHVICKFSASSQQVVSNLSASSWQVLSKLTKLDKTYYNFLKR